MVLERIANPSIGESRFLSSSLSRTAKFFRISSANIIKISFILKHKKLILLFYAPVV